MERFTIIWPEHKVISGDKIALWFSDAVANGEIDEAYASDPEFTGDDRFRAMAKELHNLGHITLARDSMVREPFGA